MDQRHLDLDAICRFCLSIGGQQYLLFGLHKDPNLVIQNVRLLTTIELSTTDNINYKICDKCCTSFELCVEFRQNCIQANKILDEIQSLKSLDSIPSVNSEPLIAIKEEIDTSNGPEMQTIDRMFTKHDDSAIPDPVNLEQYGLNFVSPPLLETESWSEPAWIGFPWEQNDLPFETFHILNQPSLPPLFPRVQHIYETASSGLVPSKMVRSKYFCKICEKHFFQRNVHMQHHEKYSKACFECLDEKMVGVYRPEATLARHTCRICMSAKETCAEFLQHAIAHHTEEHRAKDSYKCDQCDKVFVLKSENSRGKVHNCVKKLRCPHCPQAFYYAKSYQKHLRFYHNVQPETEGEGGSAVRPAFSIQKAVAN